MYPVPIIKIMKALTTFSYPLNVILPPGNTPRSKQPMSQKKYTFRKPSMICTHTDICRIQCGVILEKIDQ
jgi:hypothetical protein